MRFSIAHTMIACFMAFILGPAQATAEPVKYQFDLSHGDLSFKVMHLGFSLTHGHFSTFDGELMLDRENPENSSVAVTIPAWSIDTNWDPRDKHLRSADFFNVAEFPEITFASTSVALLDDDRATVTGDLTLLGVTKPVTLEVTLNKIGPHPRRKGIEVAGFSATGALSRSAFGMTYGESSVGDEVWIEIDIEAYTRTSE